MSKGNDKKAKAKKDKPQASASSYKIAQGKIATNQSPFVKKSGAK
jgi:hypothetical protein